MCAFTYSEESVRNIVSQLVGSPGGSAVKNLPADAGDACLIPGFPGVPEVPLEEEMAVPPGFLPGKSHGQSLAGYSP